MIEQQQKLVLSPYMEIYELVIPKDNLLRQIQIKELVDFEFIYDELFDKYCLDNGCNVVPPIRMFKYLLLKAIFYLSDVDVVERSRYDMSFKYFLDMALEEEVINPISLTKFRKLRLKDMLEIMLNDGSFSPIIERNETLPCKRISYYTTVKNNQTTLTFPIYQGECLKAEDNLKIGEMKLTKIPKAPAGEPLIEVAFIYDINGILDIEIKYADQERHKVIVNKEIGLSENELDKRVEQLKKMTLHKFEKEENRLLLEKAERLYAQATPKNRDVIGQWLRYFKETLEKDKGKRFVKYMYNL